MKKILFLLLSSLVFLTVHGQEGENFYELMMEDPLQIRQKQGTEQLLRDYMQQMYPGKDTIVAIIFIPHGCPRCEAVIPSFVKVLKAERPDEKLLAILLYDDTEAAIGYAMRERWGEDRLAVDDKEQYKKIFSFSYNYPNGVHVLKIDARSGRLIAGGQLSYISPAFIRDFMAVREPLPFHTFAGDEVEEQQPPLPTPAREKEIARHLAYSQALPLHLGDGYKLSLLHDNVVLQGDYMLLSDILCNAGFLFRYNPSEQAFGETKTLLIDSVYRDNFIDLAPAEMEANRPSFRYMAIGASFFGPDEIGLSYSVPLVFKEGENTSFYNEPLVLRWRLQPFSRRPTTDIDADITDDVNYMDMHFTTFPLGNTCIAMATEKFTYSYFLSDDSCKGNPLYDPRVDGFYDQPLPYMAQFDKRTGHLVRRFGQQEDVFRRSLTGYAFLHPVADTCDSTFVYGNGFTGLLYATASDRPQTTQRTYEVFHLDADSLPAPQTDLLYDEDYPHTYDAFFNRYIKQMTLDSLGINCLVQHGKPYDDETTASSCEYVRLSRETGQVTERYMLTPEDNREKVLSYGLRRGEGNGRVFYVAKRDGQTYVKFIQPRP